MEKEWPERLIKISNAMKREFETSLKEEESAQKKRKKLRDQREKAIKRAEEQMKSIKDHASEAYKIAQKALHENSKGFTHEMLSDQAQVKIMAASIGNGVCSKCRWRSGCLECNGIKALRHHIEREAQSAGKVPLWHESDVDKIGSKKPKQNEKDQGEEQEKKEDKNEEDEQEKKEEKDQEHEPKKDQDHAADEPELSKS